MKCGLSINFHTPEYEPEKSQRGNVFLLFILRFIMTTTIARLYKIQDILTKSNVNDVFLLPSSLETALVLLHHCNHKNLKNLCMKTVQGCTVLNDLRH